MPLYINNIDELSYQMQKRDYQSSFDDDLLSNVRHPFNIDQEIEGRKEKIIDGRSYVKMGRVDKEEGFLRGIAETVKLGLTTVMVTLGVFTIVPLFSAHFRQLLLRSWKQVLDGREHEKVTLYALKTLSHDFTLRGQQARANPWHDFNYALYLDSHSLEALKGRAGILAHTKPTYTEDFNHILETEPDSFFALNGRGQCFLITENYELALADFNRAVELVPDSISALRGQTFCYYHLNRMEEALNGVNRLLGLNLDGKEEAFLLAFRANLYLKRDLLDEALADLERAEGLDPHLPEVFEYKGYLYCQQGLYKEASRQLFLAIGKEMLLSDPQHPIGKNMVPRTDYDIHEKNPFAIPICKKIQQKVTERFGTAAHAIEMNRYVDEQMNDLRIYFGYPD